MVADLGRAVRLGVRCPPMFRDARFVRSSDVTTLAMLAVALLFLAFLAVPVSWAQDGAPQGPPPTPVKVAEVREEPLAPRRKVFGELRAARRTTVAAEEGGIVREMLVREGSAVSQGDVLARLDGTRLELERAALESSILAARATLVERELAEARRLRDRELLAQAAEKGATNPRELADAESELAIARAQVAQAKAAIAVIERQAELLSRRIADLTVRSPFAGTVTLRHAEAGAYIAEGGAVVDLSETARLEGWFDVPQELLDAAVALAARSTQGVSGVEIRTSSGTPVRGAGIRVIPEIDPRSRTFHAVVSTDPGKGALAPGLALEAYVPQGAPSAWTIVPKDALVYQGVNTSVFVVRGGVAVPVPVRVAFPLGDDVALDAAAISKEDVVVVEGNERLIPGSAVAPIPAKPRAAREERAP